MSIFDQNTPKENSEVLLYHAIKEELKTVLDQWEEGSDVMEMTKKEIVKVISKITMQFIWRKLGMKIPEYTRLMIDGDCKLIEFKKYGGYSD